MQKFLVVSACVLALAYSLPPPQPIYRIRAADPSEVQRPELHREQLQRIEVQRPEPQRFEVQRPEVQHTEVQHYEVQRPQEQHFEVQRPEPQRFEVQRPDVRREQRGHVLPTSEEIQQSNSAQYQFSSDVEDHINDLTQKRVEIRDGASVKGMYSYSDGYFMRTVEYVADDDGYRVVNEEVIPLDGPKIDLNGKATVINSAHGSELKYSVQSIPIDSPAAKTISRD